MAVDASLEADDRASSRHDVAAQLLTALRMHRWMRRLPLWRGVVTLCYHRIGDGAGARLDGGVFSAKQERFEEQVAALSQHCDLIKPEDIPDVLRHRRGRHVVLTFDDGYRDNFEVAFPILRRYGAPAAFFLATGFLDTPGVSWWDEAAWLANGYQPVRDAILRRIKSGQDPDQVLDEVALATEQRRPGPGVAAEMWMTWDMARKMHQAGMSIGGHTMTHPILGHVSVERQREEIEGCRASLERELGLPMHSFCYPVGQRGTYDDRTQQLLREAGCRLAFTCHGGYARARHPVDLLAIPRSTVGMSRTTASVLSASTAPPFFTRW